jgi:hypothetical protein
VLVFVGKNGLLQNKQSFTFRLCFIGHRVEVFSTPKNGRNKIIILAGPVENRGVRCPVYWKTNREKEGSMDILQYADTLNLEIEVTYYSNQNNRWSAKFSCSETKDSLNSGILHGTYGNGTTVAIAIVDYVQAIRGRILVVNAMSDTMRREYLVPKTLTGLPE